MPRLWLCSLAIGLLACGSAGSSGGGGPQPGAGGSFTGTAGSAGSFSCLTSATATLFQPKNQLWLVCPQGDAADPTELVLEGYHGTGTYMFKGGGGLEVTIGNTFLDAVGAGPTEPATSCTVTLTGPASLTNGDEVKASVHCTRMYVGYLGGTGGGGYVPPTYVTVDAKIDAFVTM